MPLVDGLPLSFFLPLVVHALAGLTASVTGVVAFSVPKGPARHHRWGRRYLWAYTVVFPTATILSVQRWGADAYLFILAMLGYSLALGGYSARRFRDVPWLRHLLGEYWVIAHLMGMIGSYVVLLTAFYVDNGHLFPGINRLPTIVFWVAPSLVAIPFLVRSIARFAPRVPRTAAMSAPAPAPARPASSARSAGDRDDGTVSDGLDASDTSDISGAASRDTSTGSRN